MILNELTNVMDYSRDCDETATILNLILEIVPFHHGQGFYRNAPVELPALLIELLLLLLDTPFLDFVLLRLASVHRKALVESQEINHVYQRGGRSFRKSLPA